MTRSLLFLHARPGHGSKLLRVLERLGERVDDDDVAAALGSDLGDTCTHDAAADDTQTIHSVFSLVVRRVFSLVMWHACPTRGCSCAVLCLLLPILPVAIATYDGS